MINGMNFNVSQIYEPFFFFLLTSEGNDQKKLSTQNVRL